MKHFPFGEIIKDAWKTTIHNTKLWWFGIFVGSGVSVTMPDLPSSDVGSGSIDLSANFQQIMANWAVAATVLGFLLLFFLVIYFISLICHAAILQGLVKVKKGESYKFWDLVGLGVKKTGRLFWMSLIYIFPNLILLGLALLAVPWSNLSLSGVRWWLLVPLFGLMILYNIFVSLFRHYSFCFAVIEDQSGWQSIKSGFQLMTKNVGNVLVVGLIYIGLSMASMMGMVLTMLILCLPFVFLFVLAIFVAKWLMIVVIGLGIIVLLTIALALRGAMGAYFQSYFTHAYWELKK